MDTFTCPPGPSLAAICTTILTTFAGAAIVSRACYIKVLEPLDVLKACMTREIAHLESLAYNYSKAGRRVSSDGIKITAALMKKKAFERTDAENQIVDHYVTQLNGPILSDSPQHSAGRGRGVRNTACGKPRMGA